MFLGPMLLLLVAIGIFNRGGGWFASTRSLLFLGLLALLLVCRWAEFHAGNATTSDGDPATPEHLRRYIAVAGLIGIGIWIAVNLIGAYRSEI
jgi:hypothetical protein